MAFLTRCPSYGESEPEGREGCGGTNLNPIFRSVSRVQTDVSRGTTLASQAKCWSRRAWPDTSSPDLWDSPVLVVPSQICPQTTFLDARNPKRDFKEPKRLNYCAKALKATDGEQRGGQGVAHYQPKLPQSRFWNFFLLLIMAPTSNCCCFQFNNNVLSFFQK